MSIEEIIGLWCLISFGCGLVLGALIHWANGDEE